MRTHMHVLEVYQDLLCLAFLVSWSSAMERRREWGQGKEGRKMRELPVFNLMPSYYLVGERVSYTTFSFLVLAGFLSGYVHSSSLSSDTSWSLSSGVLFLNIHRNILEYAGGILEYAGVYWRYTGGILRYTGGILRYTGGILRYTEVY